MAQLRGVRVILAIAVVVTLALSLPLGHPASTLAATATLYAWGGNGYGQLGDGTNTMRTTPVPVSGLGGTVVGISGGWSHSLAVTDDGAAWAWGNNQYGQLGNGTTNISGAPTPARVTGLDTGVRAVGAGDDHSIALKADGTVWAWGANPLGQLGDGTNSERHTPVQVAGLTGVTRIAAGDNHNLALRNDGTVWAWGDNGYGLLGHSGSEFASSNLPVQVPGLANVIGVAAGDHHSLAVTADGAVWAWGGNTGGQIGLSPADYAWHPTPTRIPGLANVTMVAAGDEHSLALKNDGTVWAWGSNYLGRLGNGTNDNRVITTPGQVQGLSGASAVAAGSEHSVAARADGTVWAWGNNINGQLGDGTTTERDTPVQTRGLGGMTLVTAGIAHGMALAVGTAPAPSPAPPSGPTPGGCVNPDHLDFGSQVVGSPGASQLATLNNCTGSPLTIAGVALGGANPGDFAIGGSCPGTTLQPGASCGVRATFTPAALGQRVATVTLTSAGGARVLTLTGVGVSATPPFTLTLLQVGGCGIAVSPGPGPYTSPTEVTLTPIPPPGSLFIGWTSEHGFAGWPDPWTFHMDQDHTITAYCAPLPTFPDYAPAGPATADPIVRLAALGVIHGYADGTFGPGDATMRAQMAALIARGMGWDTESHGTPFTDRGPVDDELWREIGTLYYYNVARGFGDGTYHPLDAVLSAQTLSFITRAMVLNGYWQQQPPIPTLYGGVLNGTGHESDVATYLYYTRAAGGVPDYPESGTFPAWKNAASRAWFSRAEWRALDSFFGRNFAP